jgi:cell surface protein SprA
LDDQRPDGSLDYFVRFRVPDIQLQEAFRPLVGFDARLKNDMSFKAEYAKSRTVSLDLGGSSMDETLATDITIGFGYKLKDIEFGFLSSKRKRKNKKKKEEDKKTGSSRPGRRSANEPGSLDITFDFSIRDDETNQYLIVEGTKQPSRGNRSVTILPQATFQLNKQLSLRFFFDYRRQEPKTTEGYPTTNIRSGVTVRFSLE